MIIFFLNVNKNDIIQLKGYNCASYAGQSQGYHVIYEISGSSLQYVLYGNVMSLIRDENFESMQSFPDTGMSFCELFGDDDKDALPGLISAENLILPVTSLTYNCYDRMFVIAKI